MYKKCIKSFNLSKSDYVVVENSTWIVLLEKEGNPEKYIYLQELFNHDIICISEKDMVNFAEHDYGELVCYGSQIQNSMTPVVDKLDTIAYNIRLYR